MSNNFPTVPTMMVQSIVYTGTISYAYAGVLTPGPDSPFYFATAVTTQVFFTQGAANTGGGISYTFPTPGDYGDFDQDTAEAAVIELMQAACNVVVYGSGDTLENVAKTAHIARQWTFTDSTGEWMTSYADSLPLT